MVALFEIAHLMYLGGDVFKEAYKGLMDRSAPNTVREKIDELAKRVDGVHDVDELRTRLVGQEIWVDLIIQVDPELSVEAANESASGWWSASVPGWRISVASRYSSPPTILSMPAMIRLFFLMA